MISKLSHELFIVFSLIDYHKSVEPVNNYTTLAKVSNIISLVNEDIASDMRNELLQFKQPGFSFPLPGISRVA